MIQMKFHPNQSRERKMRMAEEYPKFQTLLNFYNTSLFLHEELKKGNRLASDFFIVNRFLESIILELQIKLLYWLDGQDTKHSKFKQHDIKDLFQKMDDKSQEIIIKIFEDSEPRYIDNFRAMNKESNQPITVESIFLKYLERNQDIIKRLKYDCGKLSDRTELWPQMLFKPPKGKGKGGIFTNVASFTKGFLTNLMEFIEKEIKARES